jgi:rhodanese-related sulfurtransferase
MVFQTSRFIAMALTACIAALTACNRDTETANQTAADTTTQPPPATTPAPGSAPPPAPAAPVEHLDPAGAERLLEQKPGAVVLDIRTPAEYASGHIEGAVNLDFNAPGFADELAKLDRDATYVVHCGTGGRSTRSLEIFERLGFRSVAHLDGGLNAWREAGKPVTAATPASTAEPRP